MRPVGWRLMRLPSSNSRLASTWDRRPDSASSTSGCTARHGFSFFAAGPTKPSQQKDRCWRQQVDEQNRAGIPRREIAGGDDVADVADAGPDQETCQHQVGREPRLEGAESRVRPSKADPEIGDPDLELERARL